HSEVLRGADGLSGHIRVREAGARGDAVAPRLPSHRSLRRPHLPLADPRLRRVPLREGLVFPVDPGSALSPIRTPCGVAPVRVGDLRAGGRGDVRVSVIGLGKLGAPMAACFAAKGFTTIGVDQNDAYVEAINDGRAPV